VINEYGKSALHLLPSGIFRKGVVNVLGNGVALDPENLWAEIMSVTEKGVAITGKSYDKRTRPLFFFRGTDIWTSWRRKG
jgi:adenylosuccinate synthase